MGLTSDEFWLMPLGEFLDMWCCHKQFIGLEKPKKEYMLDDILMD
ncbi:hypothetical protein FACS1894219_10020 [Clostridia bacterium]|nr:hypothetical protein FACS1894219_10020 [Clostridia bacterium]